MFSFSSNLWYEKRRVSQKTGEASLYLQVTINSKHDEFKLNLRWPHDRIDLITGKLLARYKGDQDVNDYNLIIDLEKSKHTEIQKIYRLRNIVLTLKRFAHELKAFDNKESFTAYMYGKITTRYKSKEIEKKTYQNHLATLTHMKAFEPEWLFKTISLDSIKAFKQSMINANFEPGHVWGRIKDLKAYLRLASKEPMLHVDKDLLEFSNPQPNWKTTFLNREEVRRLMIIYRQGYLTDTQHNVLCAFLFTCLTSLRISDVYRINSNWRISNDQLSFIPKKGEKRRRWLHIPLMPMATHFIKNIGGKYFDLPTEVEYNRTLKELAKEAQIKKRLTSHVGRHTFGFLFMTSIGNLKALQEILGHIKVSTTERYAHLDEEYKLESVKKMQNDFTDLLMWKAK